MPLTQEELGDNPTFQATHTCFEDVTRFMLIWNDDHIRKRGHIVHAICMGVTAEVPYVHAWVEFEDPDLGRVAVQGARFNGKFVYLATPHDDFYASMRIVSKTRYSYVEAFMTAAIHNSLGPWESEHIALIDQLLKQENFGLVLGRITNSNVEVRFEPEDAALLTTVQLVRGSPEVQFIGNAYLVGLDTRVPEILNELARVEITIPEEGLSPKDE